MSDHDLERELTDRLARRARPASPRVLDNALARIVTVRQVPAPATRRGGLDRAALAVAVAAVLVAVGLGWPLVADRLAGGTGSRPAAASPQPPMRWSGVLQFIEPPNQANPAGDGYGHGAVFSYLRNGGPLHRPTEYRLLPDFASDGISRWYDATVPDLFLGLDEGTSRLELRPSGGGDASYAAILAWRSPVDASVTVTGTVEVDATCGDGIRFSLDRGAATIDRISLANGTQPFTDDMDVTVGETLYFLVEPGANDRCDTTWLTVDIATQ